LIDEDAGKAGIKDIWKGKYSSQGKFGNGLRGIYG
jgi:hypothetical protein